jgi:membrane-associated protease RseP (regulator of RpoE activity)
MSAYNRFKSEMVAGGAVTEHAPDELAGGWRGALGVIGLLGLLTWLAFINIWWCVFVVGLLISVFLHELGHFVTARMSGMKVTQFFIGFGPRLWSFRRGETEYGVRALPLGAFVRIIGMSEMDPVDSVDEQRTYRVKSYPKRILVITAGSLMHMIIAILLLFTVYSIAGETVLGEGAQVSRVEMAGPAGLAGIEAGDVILAINGVEVADPSALGTEIRSYPPGSIVKVDLVRDEQLLSLTIGLGANIDESSSFFGQAFLGVASGPVLETRDHSVASAALSSVVDIFPIAWESTKGVIKVLNPVNIFGHLTGTNDDITTRPTTVVGITGISDDVGESEGVIGILFLLAVLNVFVGVFNMFPLLPLDGGHAVIATYERFRERRGQRYYADVSKAMPFATAVIVLLLFLFASGLYLDITQPLGG